MVAPHLLKSARPYVQEKYKKNNIRNISANMFDPEIQPSRSQIMCVKTKGYEAIIRNVMTKNGA